MKKWKWKTENGKQKIKKNRKRKAEYRYWVNKIRFSHLLTIVIREGIVGTVFLNKCQKWHLSVEVGVLLVDRPTQLICISDIYYYIYLYVNRQIQKT